MKFLLVLVTGFLFTFHLSAQSFVELDLSSDVYIEKTIGLNTPGIKLINKCPAKTYKISITVEEENPGKQSGGGAAGESCDEKFPEFAKALEKLNTETKEASIKEDIANLNKALKTVNGDCRSNMDADAKKAIAATTAEYYFKDLTANLELAKNQNIIITIKSSDAEPTTWQFILKTPRTINYITHFGFTFSPNWIKEPQQYFSKAAGKSVLSADVDSFTIRKMNNTDKEFWKDLSITANFLVPLNLGKKQVQHDFNLAWTVGFGVGGDARFTAFTGPAVMLNDFAALGICGGVSYSYRLKGEYAEGQGLTENLSFDQLHNRGIRPNILLTLSFRLSKEQLGQAIEKIGGQ